MKTSIWIAAATAFAGGASAQSIETPVPGMGGGTSTIGIPSLGGGGVGVPTLSSLPPVAPIGVPNVAEPFDGCPFAMQILCMPAAASPAASLMVGGGSLTGGVSGSLGIGGLVPGVINVPTLDVPLFGGASGATGSGGFGTPAPVAPGAGGASSSAGSTFGSGGFDRMFCRPEDFACF